MSITTSIEDIKSPSATPLPPSVSGSTERKAAIAAASMRIGGAVGRISSKYNAMDDIHKRIAGSVLLNKTGLKIPSKERDFRVVVSSLISAFPSEIERIESVSNDIIYAIEEDTGGSYEALVEMMDTTSTAKTTAVPESVASNPSQSSAIMPGSPDSTSSEPPAPKRRKRSESTPTSGSSIEIEPIAVKPQEMIPLVAVSPTDPMSGIVSAVANALTPIISAIAANQARLEIGSTVSTPFSSVLAALREVDSKAKASSVVATAPTVDKETVQKIVTEELTSHSGKGIQSIIESEGVAILTKILDKAADAVAASGPKHDPTESHLKASVPEADPNYHWTSDLVEVADLIQKASANLPQNTLIVGPTGAGKCLAKGTPVLTYCGDAVPVENIKVGDRIMGPGGLPRVVTSLARGTERMYRITPIKGDSYVVNESHILSLRNTSTGRIVNISVSDYIKKSNTFKHMHKGWRSPVDFNNEFSDVHQDLPPYILGLWLGDGKTNGSSFVVYKPDAEVREELEKYAKIIGMQLKEWSTDEGDCPQLAVTNGWSGQNSRALDALRSVGVLGNKHVPRGYKCSSRENRADILAGLIDSDGSLSNNGYEYSSVISNLADDVCFITRSLGLAAYKSSKIVNGTTYYRVSISGETSIIPCRIARKKAGTRKQIKDVLNVGISVECIGEGEYFGFTLADDGTQFSRLFLLGDFTVTHNTDFAEQFSAKYNRKFIKMDCANLREPREWFGIKGASGGATYFKKSQFWHAVAEGGCVILLDEFNRAPDSIRNPLMPLLDHTRKSYVDEVGETLVVGKGTVFFATQNEGLEYTGTHATDRAMKSRFVRRVEIDYLNESEEAKVLVNKTGIDADNAKKLVEIAKTIRTKASALSGGLSDTVSTRQIIHAASDFVLNGPRTFKHSVFSHFSVDGGSNSDRAQVVNMFQLKGFKI
jgi:hypothetical protein